MRKGEAAPPRIERERLSVILCRPRNPENIGLVARAMRNTGFSDLRIVSVGPPDRAAYVTAVHAEPILDRAGLYAGLDEAVADCGAVFAATARPRKNFPALTLEEAVVRMSELPPGTRIGLLFGNERTGLSSRELRHSNFRFAIPQAFPQPSYNLASAVLLTLFPLFSRALSEGPVRAQAGPLPRSEQEACIHRIIQKLEAKRFIHARNQRHIQERIHDLFGRMTMTAEDRDLLLAVFDKGPDGRPGDEIQ